jgi:hypothetical protein
MRASDLRRVFLSWLPALLWAALILSSSNDGFSSGHSQSWLDRALGGHAPYWLNVAFRKTGHLVAYGFLGGLTLFAALRTWSRSRLTIAIALLFPLLVSIADETKQSFTVYRTGTPWDVLLDFIGAALVVSVGMLAGQRAGKESRRGRRRTEDTEGI